MYLTFWYPLCFPFTICFSHIVFRLNSTTKAILIYWAQPKTSSPQELKIGSPQAGETQKKKRVMPLQAEWFHMVSWGFCMIVVGFNELMPTTKVDHAMVVLEWFCWNMFWTCFCMVAFMMWHDNFQKTWLCWSHVAHVRCFQPVLVQVVDLGAEWLARAERKASNLRSSAVTRFDVGPSGWDKAKSKT